MEIVKAEVLWTRKCTLKCEYCAMADGRSNTYSLDNWVKGVQVLKSLGCEFIAFYGAEPLLEAEKLAPVIGIAEKVHGIDTTVITSGVVDNFYKKVRLLIDNGLRSLSMSYDIVPWDMYAERKSQKAIEGLRFFRDTCTGYRDVAAIATLHKKNYRHVEDTIKFLTEEGIWFLFDIIHPYRYQKGSKCKNVSNLPYLLFSESDVSELKKVLETILRLKSDGHLVHASEHYINKLCENDFDLLFNYNWSCSYSKNFPSWITVDCDGKVMPCDDFYVSADLATTYLHELNNPMLTSTVWDYWKNYHRKQVVSHCPGCAWNTHIDAHAIKEGIIPVSDYTHSPSFDGTGKSKQSTIYENDE